MRVVTIQHGRKLVSAVTRAKDEQLKKRLENLTDADLKKFDKALETAIKPSLVIQKGVKS